MELPQLPEVVERNTPEELSPLVDALERARLQQEEATGIREALEAEVGRCPWSGASMLHRSQAARGFAFRMHSAAGR